MFVWLTAITIYALIGYGLCWLLYGPLDVRSVVDWILVIFWPVTVGIWAFLIIVVAAFFWLFTTNFIKGFKRGWNDKRN